MQVIVCMFRDLSSESGRDVYGYVHREAYFLSICCEIESTSPLHHLEELLKVHACTCQL